MRSRFVLGGLFALLMAGCSGGGDDGNGSGADANPSAPDADPGTAPDGGTDDGFTTIISADWTIDPGTFDAYECAAMTVDEDMWIAGFRALSPNGTHHTVLSVNENPTREDGVYSCGPGDLQHSMLFASGIGTDDLMFPEGVAMKVEAGSQLHLNLHLYNVSDQQLSGPSGTQVKLLSPDEVEQQAEVVFGGTFSISIPSSDEEYDVVGGCTFEEDATVLALWPHMHQLGRHMSIEHQTSGGGSVMLHDKPFDFNEQVNYKLDPVDVKAGERFQITCTYLNDTGSTVGFGDRSTDEMCFVGIYRYPATNAGLFSCTEGTMFP